METFDPSILDVSWDDELDAGAAAEESLNAPNQSSKQLIYKQKPFTQAILLAVDCHDIGTSGAADIQNIFRSLEVFVRTRIKAKENDRVGLILYGSQSDENAYSVKGICQLFELAVPTVERVLMLKTLADLSLDEFKRRYKTVRETRGEAIPLNSAFRFALREFRIRAPATKFSRRLVVITARSDPCSSEGQDSMVSMHLAEDLLRNGCLIDVIPLKLKFDWAVFWCRIVQESYNLKQKQDTEDAAFDFSDNLMREQILQDQMRELTADSLTSRLSKTTDRQRTYQKTRMIIGEDLAIGVNVFVVVLPRKKPTGVKLRGRDRKLVKTNTQWLAESTGEIISRKELISYYDITGGASGGGEGAAGVGRGDTKVVLDKDSVRLIHSGRNERHTTDDDVGKIPNHLTSRFRMKLLGFTDSSVYDRYSFSTRDSMHFIFGSDEFVEGSRDFMASLVEALMAESKYCYLQWQYRAESIPRIYCGVPTYSSNSFPGLYLLCIPYKDDLREAWSHHEIPASEMSLSPAATQSGAASGASDTPLWDSLLQKTHELNTHDPIDWTSIQDPAILKFWNGIEILALDGDNVEEFVDFTTKSLDREFPPKILTCCANLSAQYKFAASSKKRPSAPTARATTKRRNVQSQKEAGDHYGSQTVAELKVLLRERNLPVAGVKQDLIKRLKAYDEKMHRSAA